MATILVLDGDAGSRYIAAELTKAEHRVLEARAGLEALQLARSGYPDLVIADVLLPGLDGYEFVRRLREDPAIAHTPVVFVTRVPHEPGEAIALAEVCGVLRVIAKPASPEEILATVDDVLGMPPPRAPVPRSEFDREHLRFVTERLQQKVGGAGGAGQGSSQPKTLTSGSRLRPLLLVEDNPMDVDLALQAFETHAVANPVVVLRDGEEALRYMEAHAVPEDSALPLVVLLDLRLPKVDGLEVLKQFGQHPIWKQIPVVVVTTSRESGDIESAYKLGASAYIVKPVEFSDFAETVKTIKMFWLLTNVPPFPNSQER